MNLINKHNSQLSEDLFWGRLKDLRDTPFVCPKSLEENNTLVQQKSMAMLARTAIAMRIGVCCVCFFTGGGRTERKRCFNTI